jgi:hypothetical protein
MKTFDFHENFQPQNCPLNSPEPVRAGTVGAGIQVWELAERADKNRAVMVGGASPVSISSRNLHEKGSNSSLHLDGWCDGLVHIWRTRTAFE